MRNPVWPSSCVTPAGTSNELDVQHEWEENTNTLSGVLPVFNEQSERISESELLATEKTVWVCSQPLHQSNNK